MFFNFFIVPFFDYGDVIWGDSQATLFSFPAATLVSRVSRLRRSTLACAYTPFTKYEENQRTARSLLPYGTLKHNLPQIYKSINLSPNILSRFSKRFVVVVLVLFFLVPFSLSKIIHNIETIRQMTIFHHEADCRTHGQKTFVSIAKSSI